MVVRQGGGRVKGVAKLCAAEAVDGVGHQAVGHAQGGGRGLVMDPTAAVGAVDTWGGVGSGRQ